MRGLVLLHLALILGWVFCALTLPLGPPSWIYPSLLVLHALVGCGMLRLGRADIDAAGFRVRMVNIPLLLLPPLAPTVICLMASGLALRAARRWDEEHAARRDLVRLSDSWRKLGAAGVAMGIIWSWGFLETVMQPVGDFVFPWDDPLADFRLVIGTGLKTLLLALTLWYGRLLLLTVRVMRLHREASATACEPVDFS